MEITAYLEREIRRIAWYITKGNANYEDALQIMRMSLLSIPDDTDIPLVLKIIRYDCLDVLRSRKYSCPSITFQSSLPDSSIDDILTVNFIYDQLAIEDQTIMVAYYHYGLNQSEIANILSVDKSTISKRIKHILTIIREAYPDLGG